MLFILADEDKPRTKDDIDKIISAEIPDPDRFINWHDCINPITELFPVLHIGTSTLRISLLILYLYSVVL